MNDDILTGPEGDILPRADKYPHERFVLHDLDRDEEREYEKVLFINAESGERKFSWRLARRIPVRRPQ